jgi:hypothetical protein
LKKINYKTENRLIFISSKFSHTLIISFILSLLSIVFLMSTLFILSISINLKIILIITTIFICCFLSTLLIKAEYTFSLNLGLKRKPPFQLMVSIAAIVVLLFLISGIEILDFNKIIRVLPVSGGLLILVFAYKGIINYAFISILKVLSRIGKESILSREYFFDLINFKFQEVKRFEKKFSLIMITIIVPKKDLEEIKKSMLYPVFFQIIKDNIRDTDTLGLCGNGNIAGIIADNCDYNETTRFVKRLTEIFECNANLKKLIRSHSLEFKYSIWEYSKEIENANTPINDAFLFQQSYE